MGHYHYDCEEWCEDCLPVPESAADYDSGEQDTPANCAGCGQPLDYSLTSEGVDYVLDAIIETMECGLDKHVIPLAGTAVKEVLSYYRGSPHYEIVRDWAKELQNHTLDRKDSLIVQCYLDECEREDTQRAATA